MNRQLGRRPAIHPIGVPELSRLTLHRPALPMACNWYAAIGDWPMLANDTLGDCVPAAALHCLQQRLTYAQRPYMPTDDEVKTLYRQWAGWNPADPATDQGTIMVRALMAWLHNGIVLPDRHDQLVGFANIDRATIDWIKFAIWRFGGVLIGIRCPEAWLDSDYLFDLPHGLTSVAGGHCVYLCGWEPTALGDEFDTITWGGRFRMTARAVSLVVEEAYAILDPDWLNAQKFDPAGIDWNIASRAMASLKAGALPSIA